MRGTLRLFALGCCLSVCGDSSAQTISAAVAAELQEMAAEASVIFAGEVTAVSRHDAAGFVDIRFRIDSPVRGSGPRGSSYVLREWAGLWVGHPERYRTGQHHLMLLAARSASGFSAPVGGSAGAIPIVGTGSAPLAAGSAALATATPADVYGPAADLRWIEARAARTSPHLPSPNLTSPDLVAAASVSAASPPPANVRGAPVLPWPNPQTADWFGPIMPLSPMSPAAKLTPPPLDAVVALLLAAPSPARGADHARF